MVPDKFPGNAAHPTLVATGVRTRQTVVHFMQGQNLRRAEHSPAAPLAGTLAIFIFMPFHVAGAEPLMAPDGAVDESIFALFMLS
jgi:hypothetical protein